MKKIIVLFNGINVSGHITVFALNVAKENGAGIHVLSLKDERRRTPFPNDLVLTERNFTGKDEKAENEELEEKNIKTFEAFCDDENIECHFERDISLKQLVDFSAGADLIVTNSHDDLQRYSLKDILAEAHCPVCLISVNAPEIKKTVLLYDGSDDALYAITTYSRLFPKTSELKNLLVTVNEEEKMEEDKKSIMPEFDNKFSNLERVSLSGDLEKTLIEFLDDYPENTMVVMGAYGRSAISRLVNPSLSNVILEKSSASLFIAHD